ncbi:MAG: serine/threonine protein phosphatase 1 [Paracoccaceae bacterium]|jgi:serine/threonine protein phosphatase 1
MIKSWIARKLGGKVPFGPVAPDAPFYAVGDIHGRADLLQQLLGLLNPEYPVFCVGDYVDRGEHSADVLRFLQAAPEIGCLKGNHEVMMLGFLANPKRHGANWLRNGGLQTLASFGVAGLTDTSGGGELETARDALETAMGENLINWIKSRPAFYRSGNVAVVHAGADPAGSIEDQDETHLLWGHPDFARKPRPDGLWVVHGHRIVDMPRAEFGVISIDTGAYATGQLTAALIAPDGVGFVST